MTQLSDPLELMVEAPAADTQDGTSHPLPHAVLASFFGIQFALISGFWYGMVGLGKIDWSRFSGFLIAPKAGDTTQYLLGYLACSINGTIFGLAFLYLIRPLIPCAVRVMQARQTDDVRREPQRFQLGRQNPGEEASAGAQGLETDASRLPLVGAEGVAETCQLQEVHCVPDESADDDLRTKVAAAA